MRGGIYQSVYSGELPLQATGHMLEGFPAKICQLQPCGHFPEIKKHGNRK